MNTNKVVATLHKRRDASYEVVRVLAMCFIIFDHQINAYLGDNKLLSSCLEALLCVGVTLFFMLSGRFAFNIDLKDKHLYRNYYLKKFISLIIPVLIYMMIKEVHIIIYNKGQALTLSRYVRGLVVSLVNGFDYMEYWFLYTLVANLLVVPFTARMMQNMKRDDKKAFLIVSMVFATLSTLIPIICKVEFRVFYPFIGYTLMFYAGSFIEEFFEDPRSRKKLYIAGFICAVLTLILISINIKTGYKSFSPLYFIFTTAAFVGIRNLAKNFLEKGHKIFEKIILFLGRHSLSVYMLSMIAHYFVRDCIPLPKNILGWILSGIIVFVLSLLVGIIIDDLIITPLQKLLRKQLPAKK